MKRMLVELIATVAVLVAIFAAVSGVVDLPHVLQGKGASAASPPPAAPATALPESKDQFLTQYDVDEAFGALRPDDGRPPQTNVSVHTRAAGGNDELYRSFAKAMTAENPTPADRQKDFAWVKERECRVMGWEAVIVRAEVAPAGGWYVMVSVRPILAQVGGGERFTDDRRFETYRFEGGGLRYVGGVKPAQIGAPLILKRPLN